MGKVRKLKEKFHHSKKSLSTNDLTNLNLSAEQSSDVKPVAYSISTENIFSGLDINIKDLQTALKNEFDVESVFSGRSRKELKNEMKQLPKKEKIKLRSEFFKKKLNVLHDLKTLTKQRKKRENTVIVGDMQPLLDALPELDMLTKVGTKSENERKLKTKGIMKAKQRRKQYFNDIKVFQNIWKDKTFQSNPATAITNYIKQKVASERGTSFNSC